MSEITLLDGGMGQELVHRSGDVPTPLWSTQVMVDRHGLVAEVHRDYFDAGATVATTNTYAIHRDRLVPAGIEHRFAELHALALAEAQTARDTFGRGRIAGSIGPLAASYRPELHPDPAEAVPLYREIADILADQSDLLILETVAGLAQTSAASQAAAATGKPFWVAFTVDDEDGTKLRSGEDVAEAAKLARDQGADALLANCSAPEAMPGALEKLMGHGLPIGAYANAFTQITKEFLRDEPTVDALHARRDMGPDVYADHAMKWVELGATIVGGCCETGPAHIAAIAARLEDSGHVIV